MSPGEADAAWTIAALGLGGNLGDRRGNLAAALAALASDPSIRIEAVSCLYETAPWGKTDQPAFLNAAVRIATRLDPLALLDRVLGVERGLGRERRDPWGPRSIDIDILVYGEARIASARLTVPHPHLHRRAFALAPLADVMPEAEIAGRRPGDWLSGLGEAGIERVAGPDWRDS